MDHELVIRYVSALGFPILSALAMGYALYGIGRYLAKAHVKTLEKNTEEMEKQTRTLERIETQLPRICRAR